MRFNTARTAFGRMMRTPPRVVGTVLLALTLAASSCATDGDTTETLQESEATGPVDAVDALAGAPLEQPLGSPLATDEASLWYTDFGQVARRDLVSGRWDVRELPFPQDSVFSLVMVADGTGGLKGLAGLCVDEGCDEGVVSELAAWQVTAEGEAQRIEIETPVALSDSGGNVIIAPVVGGAEAAFRVANGPSTLLVRWTDSPQVEASARAVPTLCAVPGGYVGVEDLVGEGQALAPKIVVAGPDLESLAPVEAEPPVHRLLDGLDGAASCLEDGLAVVGPEEAFELRDGTWAMVPSDVAQPLSRQLPIGLPVIDESGTLVQAGTVLNLSRDIRGWHALATSARPTGYGLVGGEIAEYPANYELPFDPETEGADLSEGEPSVDSDQEGG